MAIVRQVALSLTDAITKFRTYVRDEDSVNQAFSDSAITSQLFDVYQKLWVRDGDHRILGLSASSLWSGTAGGVALSSAYSWVGTVELFKLVRLYRESGGTPSTQPTSSSFEMEKMERHRLMWLQRNRPTPGSAPRYYCIERLDPLSTTSVIRYKLRIWPVSNAATNALGTYFSGDAVLQPPTSFDDGGDFFDLDIDQANNMVRAAAAIAASRTGWSEEFVNSLWQTIPEDMQDYLNTKQKVDKPQGGAGGEPY